MTLQLIPRRLPLADGMEELTTTTLRARVTILAMQGALPFSALQKIAGNHVSLKKVINLARQAGCSVSYLIDLSYKETDMDSEFVYTDEPQLQLFRRRLIQAMEMSEVVSAEELSRSCGIAASCVMSYLRGTRLPSATSLVKLSRGLGVSCDWLLGFNKKGKTPWK